MEMEERESGLMWKTPQSPKCTRVAVGEWVLRERIGDLPSLQGTMPAPRQDRAK